MTTTELDPDGSTVDAAGSTDDALREGRPAADVARVELARERSRAALFQIAQPARVGRFVILDSIGRGAMGVVYAAYDPQLDRKVALKLLSARAGASTGARERMLVEARALARLRHPNVVTVDDQLVIVMELVDGQTLAAWTAGGARSWREIVAHYAQAARGLDAAHALGIVHRDFKPANAIVGDDGRVRVLDFGLASAGAVTATTGPGAASMASNLTETGAIVGTPAYMPPEQLAGADVDARADQFAFAAVMWEALFGVRPFDGKTPAEVKAAVESKPPSSGSGDAPQRRVPRHLVAALQRALAADRDARWPDLAALLVALRRDPAVRRRRVAIVGGALAVGIAGTLAAVIVTRSAEAP
jgi:serine/threonine protein kinase